MTTISRDFLLKSSDFNQIFVFRILQQNKQADKCDTTATKQSRSTIQQVRFPKQDIERKHKAKTKANLNETK